MEKQLTKLKLSKETLRVLEPAEPAHVAGGITGSQFCSTSPLCSNACPTKRPPC